MKKMTVGFLILMAGAMLALADSVVVDVAVTNGQAITYSDPINVSGWLDKIELYQSRGTVATSAVVIATYDDTTARDTLVSATALTSARVIRLRVQPTDNTGTVIPAVASGTDATNTTTMLMVPYERVIIGGNVKMAVTATTLAPAVTNTVRAVIYYTKQSVLGF
jgi:hypothetical protein